ncbi:hypothetical protein ACSBR2_002394 [Camellia fascicularis]
MLNKAGVIAVMGAPSICLFQDCLSRSSSVGASLASSSTVAASPASCASLLATCVAAAFQPSLLHKFCNLKRCRVFHCVCAN